MHTNALETSSTREIHIANASSNKMQYSGSPSCSMFDCLAVCLAVCQAVGRWVLGRLAVLFGQLASCPVGWLAVLKASEQIKASENPERFYDHMCYHTTANHVAHQFDLWQFDHRGCCGDIMV